MNINEKISIFKAANDPKPGCEVPLWWVFASVQQGEFAAEIAAIRAATDPEEKARLKKLLPAATISGAFTHRSAAGLVKHSGFICLDFDGKENPAVNDWPAFRDAIGTVKEVVFCALSASGNGCFAIVPIAYPEQHKSHFEALKRDFACLGLVIDRSGADVSRLRFLSSDPGAIIHQDAVEYRRIYTPNLPKPVSKGYQTTGEDEIYRRVRQWLDRKESFINGNRNHYIMELAGGLHRFGASGEYTLRKCLEFAQDNFTAREIEACVQSIYRNQSWSNTVNN